MKKIIIILLGLLVACASSRVLAPTVDILPVMQQKVPHMTLERANQGYSLYKDKCAGCHRLYAPGQYTIAKWDQNLKEMFPKAKITNDEDKKLIRDYLHALSK